MVPETFDVPWMSRHQILTRLATYYHVVWVNPVRNWRDVLREPHRPRAIEGVRFALPPAGLSVYEAPPWLPQIHRPAFLERALESASLRAARNQLVRRGCTTIVLYVWRPVFVSTLDRVAHDLSLYHVVDEYSFSEVERPIADAERALLTRVDRVFIHSPGLLEKKGDLNPKTSHLPNGVDFEAVSVEKPEPEDLSTIDHPRIGYCGWLKKQLDWELIGQLARIHTDWNFVFVGARAQHPELLSVLAELEAQPNVHFLGAKTPEELLGYPAHFDACIMPYRMDDYTKYIYPLKLHEYLASGRPVVARPIRTLLDFHEVVELATSTEEWSRALARSLEPVSNTPERIEARRSIARAHDWNRIAYQVARAIVKDVEGETLRLFDAAPVPAEWRVAPEGWPPYDG